MIHYVTKVLDKYQTTSSEPDPKFIKDGSIVILKTFEEESQAKSFKQGVEFALIPTKTLNPSEETGLEDAFKKSLKGTISDYDINCAFDTFKHFLANGGSLEEGNPVGQVDTKLINKPRTTE